MRITKVRVREGEQGRSYRGAFPDAPIRPECGDYVAIPLGEYGGDYARTAVREAVRIEHPCTSNGCDIREANDEGFPFVAARLLRGATETPLLDRTLRALAFNGVDVEARERSEWPEWADHFDAWSRYCEGCNGYTFAEPGYEPSRCANCHAPLPDHA